MDADAYGTEPGAAGADAPRDAAVTAPPARRCIVVVDDDPGVLALVRRVLNDHDVIDFGLPDAALRAFSEGLRPHLVISDVQMPGTSGFELHEAVRRIAPLRGVPFVYLTALTDRSSLRRGMGLGADDYVTKPFTGAELREAVAARFTRLAAVGEPVCAALTLVTLGGVSLSWGEQRLTWEARKVVELLAYLLDQEAAVTLDRVRHDLWSEVMPGNHVHVLVSRLRKTLGGTARVVVVDERIQLEPTVPVEWDVRGFEALTKLAFATRRPRDVESAIAGYGGEFLGGFDSPWSDSRRAEIDSRYGELLEAAVDVAPDEAAAERARGRLEAFFGLT